MNYNRAVPGGSCKIGGKITIRARGGIRLALQPAAKKNQLGPWGFARGLTIRAAPSVRENVKAAGRAQGHNSAPCKFKLDHSMVGAFEDVTLPQVHPFRAPQNPCASKYSQRSIQESDGADALRDGRNG